MTRWLPDIPFHVRVPDSAGQVAWAERTFDDLFAERKIVLFAVPGAFTPTCSKSHLPGFEAAFDELAALGCDAVYCLSVNDAFIMNLWAEHLGIEKVTMLPDGNGDFSRQMGMLVKRTSQGMGLRSWRYALYAEDAVIQTLFSEPDQQDNPPGVPLSVSDAEHMLDYLRSRNGVVKSSHLSICRD